MAGELSVAYFTPVKLRCGIAPTTQCGTLLHREVFDLQIVINRNLVLLVLRVKYAGF